MEIYSTAKLRIRITLTPEEISELERAVIKGYIEVPHNCKRKEFYQKRSLELKRNRKKKLPWIDLALIPQNSTTKDFEKCIVTVSSQGYKVLLSFGYIYTYTGKYSEVEIIHENGILQ